MSPNPKTTNVSGLSHFLFFPAESTPHVQSYEAELHHLERQCLTLPTRPLPISGENTQTPAQSPNPAENCPATQPKGYQDIQAPDVGDHVKEDFKILHPFNKLPAPPSRSVPSHRSQGQPTHILSKLNNRKKQEGKSKENPNFIKFQGNTIQTWKGNPETRSKNHEKASPRRAPSIKSRLICQNQITGKNTRRKIERKFNFHTFKGDTFQKKRK